MICLFEQNFVVKQLHGPRRLLNSTGSRVIREQSMRNTRWCVRWAIRKARNRWCGTEVDPMNGWSACDAFGCFSLASKLFELWGSTGIRKSGEETSALSKTFFGYRALLFELGMRINYIECIFSFWVYFFFFLGGSGKPIILVTI